MPLINTYRQPVELFVDGESMFSTEGRTQGDPMGMPLCGFLKLLDSGGIVLADRGFDIGECMELSV